MQQILLSSEGPVPSQGPRPGRPCATALPLCIPGFNTAGMTQEAAALRPPLEGTSCDVSPCSVKNITQVLHSPHGLGSKDKTIRSLQPHEPVLHDDCLTPLVSRQGIWGCQKGETGKEDMLKSEACEIKSERSSATSAPSGAVSTLPGSAKLSVGESNGIEYGTHAGEDAFPPPFSSTCKEESPCVSVPALVSAPTVDSLHAEIQSLELLTHLRTAARRWALYHDNFFFHWDRLCFEWKVRRKRQAATGVQEDSQSTPCEPGVVKNRDSLDQQEEKRGENFQDSVDIFCAALPRFRGAVCLSSGGPQSQCLSVLLQQLDARRRCLDPAYLPFNRYLSIPTVTPFSLSRTRSLSRQDSWRTFSIEAFSSPELDSHCNSSLSGAIGGCGGQGGLKGSPRSQEHQAFQNPQASPWTSDALGSSKTSSEGFKEAHLDKSLPHPHDSLPLSASPAAAAATKALRAAASALSNSRWCAPNCSKVRDGPCSCTSCGEEEGKEAHCGLSSSLQQEVSRDLFRGPFCGRPASRSKHGSLLGPVLLDTGGHSRPSHHTFMNGASTPGSSPGVGAPADAGPADAVTFQRRSNDGSMPSQKKEEEAENPGGLLCDPAYSDAALEPPMSLNESMVVDSTEAEQLATYIPSSAPSSLVRCNVGGEGAAPKAVRKSSHIVVEDAGMRLSFVARKGVYYDKRRRLWRANWKENGRIHTKGFSVHDYLSHEAARQKAIEFRERKEQEIELYQQIRSPRTFTDEDWNFKPQTQRAPSPMPLPQ
ncbi:hypothetical protein cyc_00043 [Cyclospora cayetanensis]|uniref:AP2/ERF domain-containing protein n=1 Tax=Cyclospora cayetanensis TaxID=88456 RepID=A0A1D3CSH8_9EIME|nr:hypothetical protein cyc_00043 [Cyclospora cayetanensis]